MPQSAMPARKGDGSIRAFVIPGLARPPFRSSQRRKLQVFQVKSTGGEFQRAMMPANQQAGRIIHSNCLQICRCLMTVEINISDMHVCIIYISLCRTITL